MESQRKFPKLVCHADWGSNPQKRWFCRAVYHGNGYTARASNLIGDHLSFLNRVQEDVGDTDTAVVGFDFPIGIPAQYAALIGISEFKSFLLQLGHGDFSDFFQVCEQICEISKYRPFYPRKPGSTRHSHLLAALNVPRMNDLRRKCEREYSGRKAACPLFWTLGANQVGRAAIIGWRDVIIPALHWDRPPMLWPFDGCLDEVLKPGNIVIVETYPAEYYPWLVRSGVKGKGKLEIRKQASGDLLNWARDARIALDRALEDDIERGFPAGDDAFDATAGLFGMLDVLLDRRKTGEPEEPSVKELEGWIFGQSGAPFYSARPRTAR